MAIKKSELYSSIWTACDELRGRMDASQYKDYVLVLLFMKYVSDKYADKKNALIDVPRDARYTELIALKGDKEIGDKINKVIGRLADANDLKGVIDVADFNDGDKLGRGKEMVDRLSKLVAVFDRPEFDFKSNRAEGDDLLGDAYEYLMRNFATQSGKSKGQFYTPAEVSRIMAKVIGIDSAKSADQTVYDPTCGSGSLLIKAHDAAPYDVTIYGQESDNATAALATMNMYLHGCPTAEIWNDNTLAAPRFKEPDGRLKTFDFAVANPPFSTKAWTHGFSPANDEFHRFPYGLPPSKNGDYAFLLHVIASLKSTGKGAVIMPHGVLFRGGAEGDIRRAILKQGFIRGLIGLPANLFYGTGIPACIVVLDKSTAAGRKGVFLIDASKGFLKDGPKNRLREQDIHKIVDTFVRQAELPKYSRLVPMAEIETNDFNLNLPRYIDGSEAEDLQDIDAHLRGGIPNRDLDDLGRYWEVLPSLRAVLFKKADRPGYSQLKVPVGEIKATIFDCAEFAAFNETVTGLFGKWRRSQKPKLTAIAVGGKPKTLIGDLSEGLLDTFREAPLVDAYDVYQHLMDYWAATMQDDVYQLVQDGWRAVVEGKPNTDLIPEALVIERHFAAEQAAVEMAEAARDGITRQMEELEEEHGGEDGLLAEAKNDKGGLTAKSVNTRLAEVKGDKEAADEQKLLKRYLALAEKEMEAGAVAKDSKRVLDSKVMAKYPKLTVEEIKTLVVDDKWLASLADAVQSELNRVSQTLTGRVRQLAERYATPLPKLAREVESLTARVDGHLKKMGFECP
jgi:type I restriction enzyme M protein